MIYFHYSTFQINEWLKTCLKIFTIKIQFINSRLTHAVEKELGKRFSGSAWVSMTAWPHVCQAAKSSMSQNITTIFFLFPPWKLYIDIYIYNFWIISFPFTYFISFSSLFWKFWRNWCYPTVRTSEVELTRKQSVLTILPLCLCGSRGQTLGPSILLFFFFRHLPSFEQ